ncbi:MAG TPA: glycosyltransferase family 9 protein [Puia sp.]|nr:glycosyltransferase family 9 protein [Puia sp.]
MQISVVIPTCDRKQRLLSLLDDLNSSSYPLAEVIVVDSGADRLTAAEIAGFPRLNIVYTTAAKSVCIQRNTGIKKARSPWVLLCDDDIEVPVDYIQRLVDHCTAHTDSGAASGLFLQQEKGEWTAQYPERSAPRLAWNWLFQLSIWGSIDIQSRNPLIRYIKNYYRRKGNHISKAGWPVITDFRGDFFTTPLYSLGACLVKKTWLDASPFDEVLDRYGMGDNYGVTLGFPGKGIDVLNKAFVYHHKEPANRLARPLQYSRRAFALDYFIYTRGFGLSTRPWLLWSLTGRFLGFLLARDRSMIRPALATIKNILTGNNPYIVTGRPWPEKELPRRILAIRLQATGDVTITLPYLQHLRRSLPATTRLDLLTRQETAGIPRHLGLFNRIYALGGQRNFKKQVLCVLLLLPRLLFQRYDLVIDLQNSPISRLVRKMIRPKGWSAFDRFSPRAAGDRTRLTIEAAGLGYNQADTGFQVKMPAGARKKLIDHGWQDEKKLVVLNPAGASPTRNWPLSNYIAFARLWLREFPDTQFLVLGTNFIAEKAAAFKKALGADLVDLVGETTTEEAFSILQLTTLVLSEDSGLMHMAWISGIPTVALFGSTRSDWSRPLGDHTILLGSSDLPCGDCLQALCRYGDNHCLTRWTPAYVLDQCLTLIPAPHVI